MQHELVIPLPLRGSETKTLTQADLVVGVQVRICADNVCSLQVISLPNFCAYAMKTNVAIALHSMKTTPLMLLRDTDLGVDYLCLHPLQAPPSPPPPRSPLSLIVTSICHAAGGSAR